MIVSDGVWEYYSHLQVLNTLLLYLAAKKIHRLATFMPPQHGKSELISKYFPAWFLGTFPRERVLHASYEADFAGYWSRHTRDIIREYGKEIFNVEVNPEAAAAKHWELLNFKGGMQSSGVGGPLTGKKGSLINIDDPHKNYQEASSETYQTVAEDWYTTAVDTRLPKNGILNLVMTRWHPKDLGGRIFEVEDKVYADEALPFLEDGGVYKDTWVVLNLPAICEEPAHDVLGRGEGEALCPELFPLDVLIAKQKRMTKHRFGALYQQHPTPRDGDLFDEDMFRVVREDPRAAIVNRLRWWDLAGTEASLKNDPDWTVGLLLGNTADGRVWGLGMERFRKGPAKVRARVENVVVRDGPDVRQRMGLDPGQAGIDQIDSYRKLLRGYPFRGVRESGSKYVRADTVAGVLEVEGPMYLYEDGTGWTDDFLDEVLEYPNSAYKDIVDSLSNGYPELMRGYRKGTRRAVSEKRYTFADKRSAGRYEFSV
jgi:predicted phage terminase large subunit-like protein